MALTKKDNHLQEALGNLVAQFKGKPRLAALITAYTRQVQDLENAYFELLLERQLEAAEGLQVDGFGTIVGEAREGRNDLDYKTAIRARIVLNLSRGLTEDIIALLRGVAGDVKVKVIDYYPARFVARIMDPIDSAYVNPAKLGNIVDSGRAAGVDGAVTYYVAGPFQFDAGLGFDEGKFGGAS